MSSLTVSPIGQAKNAKTASGMTSESGCRQARALVSPRLTRRVRQTTESDADELIHRNTVVLCGVESLTLSHRHFRVLITAEMKRVPADRAGNPASAATAQASQTAADHRLPPARPPVNGMQHSIGVPHAWRERSLGSLSMGDPPPAWLATDHHPTLSAKFRAVAKDLDLTAKRIASFLPIAATPGQKSSPVHGGVENHGYACRRAFFPSLST